VEVGGVVGLGVTPPLLTMLKVSFFVPEQFSPMPVIVMVAVPGPILLENATV